MDNFEPLQFVVGIIIGVATFYAIQWLYYRWRDKR